MKLFTVGFGLDVKTTVDCSQRVQGRAVEACLSHLWETGVEKPQEETPSEAERMPIVQLWCFLQMLRSHHSIKSRKRDLLEGTSPHLGPDRMAGPIANV